MIAFLPLNGYPASEYEGINVEVSRNRCGEALAKKDDVVIDLVAGIPDSGIGHAIGYANSRKIPYARPFVKYTPTWPRSFMPQNQEVRDLAEAGSERNVAMIEWIRNRLHLSTLKYQRLQDLVEAIGLPKEKLCTHCWDGSSYL